VERLPAELTDIAQRRTVIIEGISRLSCWKLTYGGPPTVAVRGLQEFIAQQMRAILA